MALLILHLAHRVPIAPQLGDQRQGLLAIVLRQMQLSVVTIAQLLQLIVAFCMGRVGVVSSGDLLGVSGFKLPSIFLSNATT